MGGTSVRRRNLSERAGRGSSYLGPGLPSCDHDVGPPFALRCSASLRRPRDEVRGVLVTTRARRTTSRVPRETFDRQAWPRRRVCSEHGSQRGCRPVMDRGQGTDPRRVWRSCRTPASISSIITGQMRRRLTSLSADARMQGSSELKHAPHGYRNPEAVAGGLRQSST